MNEMMQGILVGFGSVLAIFAFAWASGFISKD